MPVKFGSVIDHKRNYISLMKYCFSVRNYKHGDDGELGVTFYSSDANAIRT